MDPLSALASVITVYQLATKVGGVLFGYAQGVKRADSEVHFIIDEINNFQSSLQSLSGLLQNESLHREHEGERLLNLREALSEEKLGLRTCQEELERILRKLETKTERTNLKQARALIDRLKWPLLRDDIDRLCDSMRLLCQQIEWAQSVDSLSLTRAIDTRTRQMDARMQAIDASTQETNEGVKQIGEHLRESEYLRHMKEQQKENEDILKQLNVWLGHSDPEEDHDIAVDLRNKNANTGLWFLEGEKFLRFKKSRSTAILWLHGDPGTGKTVLAAGAIDDIRASSNADNGSALVFWYFNSNDKQKASFDQCLRTLLSQLASRYKTRLPPSIKSLSAKKNKSTLRRFDIISTISRLAIEEDVEIIIVLDALDECRNEDIPDLLQFIHSFQQLESSLVRILVTSRNPVKDQFQERFLGSNEGTLPILFDVPIEMDHLEADIKSHIEEKLANDPSLNKWRPEIRQLISEKLSAGAQGMFRWVDCQLKDISKCKTPGSVKRALGSLPANLQDQYRRDLDISKVPNEHEANIVLSILRWSAFPQRKITLDEAAELAGVTFNKQGEASFDPDERLDDPKLIFDLCGSLIRVDLNESGVNYLGDRVEGVQSLTTSHSTVIDFLTSEEIKVGPLEPEIFSKAKVSAPLDFFRGDVHRSTTPGHLRGAIRYC